ncbi:STAS domain-containing protein [Tautonia sociabilis]|uniref:Anti-sigma factor antagonist n=1 Tax=Tautonia sociabilis TaxID=2080755 RepID=A0A432MFV1_9BACT|nr:STAS domain-containing protein [Tautonia sociabilis]RUL85003.1 anti-sigma factor antagonist [Tautonia sociabilis]
MLSPKVELRTERGVLYAEFWDCLRLDPAPVKELLAKYKTASGGAGRPDLIVDFSGVTFAGSAALSGFVNLQRAVRQNGGKVVLCNLEPTVAEAFRLSRIDSLFTAVPDPEAAFTTILG